MRSLTLLLVLASGASAQEAGDVVSPEALRVGLGATLPLAGDLGPAWAAQPGARGELSLGMYGGETRLLLGYATHDATDDEAPDFSAVTAMLGWGPVFQVGPVRLIPGAEIGAGRYEFDDDGEFDNELAEESEVVAGAYLRASVPLAGRLEAWAETGVRRTFFSTVATTAGASGGISIRL